MKFKYTDRIKAAIHKEWEIFELVDAIKAEATRVCVDELDRIDRYHKVWAMTVNLRVLISVTLPCPTDFKVGGTIGEKHDNEKCI